ncbi:MAG: hypothetical protein PHH59_02450 [Methylovulum sp.]|uniref:hypothetical protein n=1 Tax=Methylovulum sp. TaxID=1916980 RepID=UPI0026284345|nr:hypothetical protein [Methylovulum sp.]MDD2722870.1 hypothetical protein [Methylovulum sp.]
MMTITRVAIFTGLCMTLLNTNAGTIKKGGWTANDCGDKPVAPELDFESIDSYNESATAMNAWQKESAVYLECLSKEANADIKQITDAVNAQQKEYKELVEKNSAEAADYKEQILNNNNQPQQ